MNFKFYGCDSTPVLPVDERFGKIRSQYDLYALLDDGIWCRETCAPRMRDGWSEDNKTHGQCSITSFLAQDIFGGQVFGVKLEDGNVHCFNKVGNSVFDLTSEQFGNRSLDYSICEEQFREVHFAKEEKKERYEYLKKKLLEALEKRTDALRLGFGLMRLPMLDSNEIDIEKCKIMTDMFIEKGFTYFDTAWMYCGFKSEDAVKEFLVKRYPRNAYTLTTKLHAGFFDSKEEIEDIFKTQLEKTGVDYFDYYLLHDLGADLYDKYEKYDCFGWLMDKKAKGLVKHVGFSFHDNAKLLDRILTEHPEMEFVQLQINYLDWGNPAIQSRQCYEVAVKHNMPVIVMEPVKGGTIAKVPKKAEEVLKGLNPEMSIPSWAIRFAASLPNVFMVLSGMSNEAQIEDNLSYMREFKPLKENEKKAILEVTDIITSNIAIPCTGCAYCVEGCPMSIPIPKYFSLYNTELLEWDGKGFTQQGEYYDRLAVSHGRANACIGCGQCESACPQHLNVTDYLKKVSEMFDR